jgi:hypothetical protein
LAEGSQKKKKRFRAWIKIRRSKHNARGESCPLFIKYKENFIKKRKKEKKDRNFL